MKGALLKAQAKKQKYLKRIEKIRKEEDSDGSLSSDDEEEVSDSMVGSQINNQYLILKYLGKGTFSKTWLVYDYLEDNFRALKLHERKYFEELDIEIANFKKLQKNGEHPNVIKYYGDLEFKNGETSYRGILLDVLGDSLDSLLDEEYDSKLNLQIVRKIFTDLLNGLGHIHSSGLVHNDLKFDNVLFTKPNKKMETFIEKVRELKINQYYLEKIEELTPPQIQLLDKNKRKMVKRKIKEKANKQTTKHYKNEIIRLNNSTMENLTLEISEDEEMEKDAEEIEKVSQEKQEDSVKEVDEIKKIEIDLEDISIKIIDMGSAEIIGKMESDEILCRSYRPPENILNSYYDNKADIWVIGCLLYEFLNGMPLFDLKDCKLQGKDKDRAHIAQMFDALGKMPREMALECEFSEDIFDNKGRVLKNKGIEERDIKKELCERFDIEDEKLSVLEDTLRKILVYDIRKRPLTKEILEMDFFSKCD